MKCNETIGKWYKNKHGASKIIDTFETYHTTALATAPQHQHHSTSTSNHSTTAPHQHQHRTKFSLLMG
jgi:hypothetical protein